MQLIDLNSITQSLVLVRVSYDLPSLEETARIEDSVTTIKLLLSNGNKVILLTKWGRPKGEFNEKLSTKLLLETIESVFTKSDLKITVEYLNQFNSFDDAGLYIAQSENKVFLLENTQFSSDETSNDSSTRKTLAEKYSILGNMFVDEAFPSSHRHEATNSEIKHLLPWTYGLSYKREIEFLESLKNNPIYPFVIIMGGAKLETKLPLIETMVKKGSHLIISGMLCFTFIEAARDLGWETPEIHQSHVEKEFMDKARFILQENGHKIFLPLDFVFDTDKNGNKVAFDIGQKTIDRFSDILAGAKTVFWNGTMGYVEKPPFDNGTNEIAYAIAQLENATTIIGGGDTTASLPKEIVREFSFISMGGGATLDFLAKE